MTNGNAKPRQVPAAVHVTSFAYGHGPTPVVDITLNLRRYGDFSDLEPDSLLGLTGCATCAPLPPAADGLPELVEGIVPAVRAFRSGPGDGPGDGPVTVAVGGADGRLSATVATAMHRRMGHYVRVTVEPPSAPPPRSGSYDFRPPPGGMRRWRR